MGPARYALHHSIADLLCSFVEEIGAKARREAFAPEFADPRKKHSTRHGAQQVLGTASSSGDRRSSPPATAPGAAAPAGSGDCGGDGSLTALGPSTADEVVQRSAVFDIWDLGSLEVHDLLVDVTFRHAGAERYVTGAAQEAGWTSRTAEREKQDRYAPPPFLASQPLLLRWPSTRRAEVQQSRRQTHLCHTGMLLLYGWTQLRGIHLHLQQLLRHQTSLQATNPTPGSLCWHLNCKPQ